MKRILKNPNNYEGHSISIDGHINLKHVCRISTLKEILLAT